MKNIVIFQLLFLSAFTFAGGQPSSHPITLAEITDQIITDCLHYGPDDYIFDQKSIVLIRETFKGNYGEYHATELIPLDLRFTGYSDPALLYLSAPYMAGNTCWIARHNAHVVLRHAHDPSI